MASNKPENSQLRIILWLVSGTIAITAAVLAFQLRPWENAASTQNQPAYSRSDVTPGKAAMIEDVRSLNPDLSFDALAALTAGELEQLYQTGAPALPVGLSYASHATEEYAGTLAADSVTADAEPKLLDNPPCYAVELHHPALGDFKYKIDAYSGEVLEGRSDILRYEYVPSDGGDGGDAPEEPDEESLLPLVGEDAAKAAALRLFGVAEDDAANLQIEPGWDDFGNRTYYVAFQAGRGDYSCVLDAATGRVLHSEELWHAGE